MKPTGLSTHIWNNNLRCIIVLLLYPVLLLLIFYIMLYALSHTAAPSWYSGITPEMGAKFTTQRANNLFFAYWPLILTGTAIWFMVAWFFHTNMIRKLAHSHPVTRQEEPELYNLLENLCISRGMPMPHLEIIETHARNAFASGISEKNFAVTVTRGLMNSLSKDELEAVLAHELTHIQNRDVRLLIICVIFTGLFGFLAQLAWSNIRYSVFYSGRRREGNRGSTILIMIIIAVILWLGYLATLLMRFALSRRREYMADAGAVEMTKNPDAMMRALMRIAGRDRIPGTADDIALMCIENHVPFMGLFATHPPIEKRIKTISEVTGTPIPDSLSLPPIEQEKRFSRRGQNKNPWLTRQRRK